MKVRKNRKWGYVSSDGQMILPPVVMNENNIDLWIASAPTFSYPMAYNKKAASLRNHQGEFEKKADFEARQADEALQKAYLDGKMKGFDREFAKGLVQQFKDKLSYSFSPYDPDHEVFDFTTVLTPWGQYSLHVPIAEAPAFKEFASNATPQELLSHTDFFIYMDCLQVARMTFILPDGKTYVYIHPQLKNYSGDIIPYAEIAPDLLN